MLVGGSLAVALLMPNASAAIFALTGATGVCLIGYIFPIYSYWKLPPELGGAPLLETSGVTWSHVVCAWLMTRMWPALVVALGTAVSILTLLAVYVQFTQPQQAGMCSNDS